jgi:hypothetical protein
VGFRLQEKPAGEFKIELVRVIVPVNPPSPLVDIVDVAGDSPVTEVGEADMVKSQTVYWMPTEWERAPLTPFTATV